MCSEICLCTVSFDVFINPLDVFINLFEHCEF